MWNRFLNPLFFREARISYEFDQINCQSEGEKLSEALKVLENNVKDIKTGDIVEQLSKSQN